MSAVRFLEETEEASSTPNDYQFKALAIIPKVTGSISFVCSLYLIQTVLRDPQKRTATFHRLVLGISVGDCIGSMFGAILSTWPMPVESGVYGALGSLTTCDAAGFLNQAGNLMTPLYNGMLALFYLMLLRWRWTDSKIRRAEPYMHLVPNLLGWSTAIAAISLHQFAPANWTCWIAKYPRGCDSEETCERGWRSEIYRWFFLYGFVWFTIIFVTVAMTVVYLTVRRVEDDLERYRFEGDTAERRHEKSRRVMWQGIWFVGGFFLTWIFPSIERLQQLVGGSAADWVHFCAAFFFPCQGFFNLLVYNRSFRKLKRKIRKVEENLQHGKSWRKWIGLCPCFKPPRAFESELNNGGRSIKQTRRPCEAVPCDDCPTDFNSAAAATALNGSTAKSEARTTDFDAVAHNINLMAHTTPVSEVESIDDYYRFNPSTQSLRSTMTRPKYGSASRLAGGSEERGMYEMEFNEDDDGEESENSNRGHIPTSSCIISDQPTTEPPA